jgi:hypothetical protein
MKKYSWYARIYDNLIGVLKHPTSPRPSQILHANVREKEIV